MAHSPWGQIDSSKQITRGVRLVGTPGHGGIMVTRNFAATHLSSSAIARGEVYGNYVCYEEDCDYAIVEYELLRARLVTAADLYHGTPTGATKSEAEILAQLAKSLSSWNADYLMEIGIQPVEPEYTHWRESKESDRRRAEKDGNFIVAALNVGPGMVKVWTADDHTYIVIGESYKQKTLNLLSDCTLVPKHVVANVLDVQGQEISATDRQHLVATLKEWDEELAAKYL
jgi:hypothetical protein